MCDCVSELDGLLQVFDRDWKKAGKKQTLLSQLGRGRFTNGKISHDNHCQNCNIMRTSKKQIYSACACIEMCVY